MLVFRLAFNASNYYGAELGSLSKLMRLSATVQPCHDMTKHGRYVCPDAQIPRCPGMVDVRRPTKPTVDSGPIRFPHKLTNGQLASRKYLPLAAHSVSCTGRAANRHSHPQLLSTAESAQNYHRKCCARPGDLLEAFDPSRFLGGKSLDAAGVYRTCKHHFLSAASSNPPLH